MVELEHKYNQFYRNGLFPSWLNMVALELSAIARSCLHQRLADMEALQTQVSQLVKERNQRQATVHWQFTNTQAREKLNRHYQAVYRTN